MRARRRPWTVARDCLLSLQSFVPLPCLNLTNITHKSIISPFVVANIPYSMISVSRVEPCDKLWDQMRMFARFLHSW
jgi:hypothetical protein